MYALFYYFVRLASRRGGALLEDYTDTSHNVSVKIQDLSI
jgi:hypothetical protein